MKKIIFIKKGKNSTQRPYFLYKIVGSFNEVQKTGAQYPKTKYFYLKTYNTRNGETKYAVYLNKVVDRF